MPGQRRVDVPPPPVNVGPYNDRGRLFLVGAFVFRCQGHDRTGQRFAANRFLLPPQLLADPRQLACERMVKLYWLGADLRPSFGGPHPGQTPVHLLNAILQVGALLRDGIVQPPPFLIQQVAILAVCAAAITPGETHALTVFSLRPSSRAAITGRMVLSSARAAFETSSKRALRSSSSGSLRATSSTVSTRSKRLRIRCSSMFPESRRGRPVRSVTRPCRNHRKVLRSRSCRREPNWAKRFREAREPGSSAGDGNLPTRRRHPVLRQRGRRSDTPISLSTRVIRVASVFSRPGLERCRDERFPISGA